MLVNLFFALIVNHKTGTLRLFMLSFRLRVASTRLETNSRIIPTFTAEKLKTLRIIEQKSDNWKPGNFALYVIQYSGYSNCAYFDPELKYLVHFIIGHLLRA